MSGGTGATGAMRSHSVAVAQILIDEYPSAHASAKARLVAEKIMNTLRAEHVTGKMLEAAHRAEVEHYKRNYPDYTMLATTPFPVLKSIVETALSAM
jgi:hypothetical protein